MVNLSSTKKRKLSATQYFCYNGIIAALYFTLVFAFQFLSFKEVQFRVAECLTILPAVFPFSILGITVGCFLSNFLSIWGWSDLIFGTLCTLIAAYVTSKIKSPYLAVLPPIILNAFGLPLVWLLLGGAPAYWINVAWVFLGQAVVLYTLGIPTYYLCKKHIEPIVYPFMEENQP